MLLEELDRTLKGKSIIIAFPAQRAQPQHPRNASDNLISENIDIDIAFDLFLSCSVGANGVKLKSKKNKSLYVQ